MPVSFADNTWTVQYGPADDDRYFVSMVDHYFSEGDPTCILGGVPLGASRERAVIIDANVHRLYWDDTIAPYFRRVGIVPLLKVLPVSEETKTMETVLGLADWLLNQDLDRRNQPVIAIGGGVLTDIVGTVAMLWLRGVGWVRIVTSTQMWDAGNSGKVAVNFKRNKSKLGGFYPPLWSIMDRTFLQTVPDPNLVDGYAEIVKDAAFCDSLLFDLCAEFGPSVLDERFQGPANSSPAVEMMQRAATVNLTENADNITEKNLNRAMHAGHTWGPKGESHSYAIGKPQLHGHTVSWDLALTTELSRSRGLPDADADSVLTVLRSVGLPTYHPMMSDRALMTAAHESAIRSRAGRLRAPMLKAIAVCEFVDQDEITVDHLMAAAARLAS